MFRQILDRMPEHVILLDQTGRIRHANASATKLLDASNEAAGTRISEAIPPLGDAVRAGADRVKIIMNGKQRTFTLNTSQVDDGAGNTGTLLVLNEAPQRNLNHPPSEQTLQENGRLKDLNHRKDMLIYTATHEMQTPLTSMKGYLKLINTLYNTKLPTETAKALKIIERNTDRLCTLTADLMDLQRIETGRMTIKPTETNLTDAINDALNELEPLAYSRNITITPQMPEEPLIVKADRARTMQVLINVINNAVKFSPNDGRIDVKAAQTGGEVTVAVTDQGLGIRGEDIQKLFKPFPCIKKPDTIPSTGLGLSICKSIIEAQGGEIRAHSPGPQKGSTFTFTLPAIQPSQEPYLPMEPLMVQTHLNDLDDS